MNAGEQASYRLKLAQGFLDEARQDMKLRRWRSAVDNAQLSVENSSKAVLGLLGPISRTHNSAPLLRQAISEGLFSGKNFERVRQLVEQTELLGPDIHMQTDYGDEPGGRTPWELFGEPEARQAVDAAERAVQLAEEIIRGVQS